MVTKIVKVWHFGEHKENSIQQKNQTNKKNAELKVFRMKASSPKLWVLCSRQLLSIPRLSCEPKRLISFISFRQTCDVSAL